MGDSDNSFDFRKSRRLTRQGDFDAVFKHGRVLADHMLVLHLLPNHRGSSRLGLSLSKRVGCAPLRNRWKRLLREAFRLNRANLPTGFDIVARPKKGAEPDFSQIQRSLVKLCNRANKRPPA